MKNYQYIPILLLLLTILLKLEGMGEAMSDYIFCII